jgi:tRNA 2-thiouridine synthesizing protein B
MILHTVNKSSFHNNSLDACLRVAQAGCGIVLIEDGVYAATDLQNNRLTEQILSAHTVYALVPDLKARGLLARVLPGIELVDYQGFVALTESFDSVQSWY